MHIVPENIEKYSLNHTQKPEPIFQTCAEFTQKHSPLPQMLIGPTEGFFLRNLIRVSGMKNILEIGTFTGYSAMMMAAALPGDGKLITCELDEQHAGWAQSFFDKSPWGSKITLKLGPALQTLMSLNGPFDLVFIDADKANYPNYYEHALRLLRPHGLVVLDNMLWSGNVLNPPEDDPSATILNQLNGTIQADSRVDNILLPIRDGIMLATKR